MRFVWPDLLWVLLLVPALAGGYLLMLRRKRRAAVRYASLALVREAIGPRHGLRRHVPPLLLLLAVTSAVVAVARPRASVLLPSDHLTIVLAIDVSRSMLARDITPTRFAGAQEAARAFIGEMPPQVRLGIVAFAGTASVVQTPTSERQDLLAAIDRLQLQRHTATGSAIIVSLAALLPDGGLDLESAVFGAGFGHAAGDGEPLGRRRLQVRDRSPPPTPVAPGSHTAGGIILMSDGRRTTGPDPLDAARLAAERGVRVHTVGFGTVDGATVETSEGWSFFAQLDQEALRGVAHVTAGEYFHAASTADLGRIYRDLGTRFTLERGETEVGGLFAALAALLLAAAAIFSLLWFAPPPKART